MPSHFQFLLMCWTVAAGNARRIKPAETTTLCALWNMCGMGRELGRQGLHAVRRSKRVISDHQPQTHDWWYPDKDEVFYRET